MSSILVTIVVHNDKTAQILADACLDRGATSLRVADLRAALDRLSEAGGGALALDLAELSTKSDKKINATLSAIDPSIKILGLGSGYDVKSVTSFYRSGMYDFLDLPLDPFLLSRALNNVLGSLSGDSSGASSKVAGADPPKAAQASTSAVSTAAEISEPAVRVSGDPIVGQDPGLMKVFRVVEKVAATDSTVMIHGESGTGKELIARAIHQASARSQKPMIPVNCGAIPEELLETELFGHEKGAFTNAIRDRVGRFEMADGGTIFLDEIGDMSPKLQVKLLRVIQEHEFERVGGDKTISVNIRVITATHVNLTRAVEEGRFREDLYYRLNVIPLTIPPLRARSSDVPLLVDYFLSRLRQTRGSKVTGLAPDVLAILKAYHWPGNIRELENLMERMVILADGPVLTRRDLPQRLLSLVESQLKAAPPRQAPAADLGAQGPAGQPNAQSPGGDQLSAPSPSAQLKTRAPASQDAPSPSADLHSEPAVFPAPGASGQPDNDLGDQPFWPDFSKLPGASSGFGTRPRAGGSVSSNDNLQSGRQDSLQEEIQDPASQAQDQSPSASSAPAKTASEPGPAAPDGRPVPPELYKLIQPIIEFPPQGVDLFALMGDFEDRLIRTALKANSGVKNQTAKALGLSRTTFLDKLKKRGLD
jgi:DNA-binding NtrC family response regulator